MKITFSIFPKFYRHLDVAGLAALVREVGLDATNMVIRDGYWVTMDDLAAGTGAFVKGMREEGIEVRFATAGFPFDEMIADPAPLHVLAEHGIREFRPGYFRRPEDGDVRGALDRARASFEKLAPLCERAGIRCVYQIHHKTLVSSPSGVWPLVCGLPAEAIGVMIDPGNQAFEGMEDWDRSVRLLGEHLVAVGVKDVALARGEDRSGPRKGWRREWVPADEGVTDWHALVRALGAVDFTGTFVWMPFYDENDPDEMTGKLKREVAYLRRVVSESGTP
jgi:sugar phosphate isomerase/epimerase